MSGERIEVGSAAAGYLEALASGGVSYVFGSPGSEDVHYWREFSADDGRLPAYVQCRHEQLAVDMARGYARLTGEPQAVKLHGSLGTLNGALGIWGAYYTGTPLVVLSSYVSDHSTGTGSYQLDFRHPGGHEAIFGPFSKWSVSPDSNDHGPEYAARAARLAAASPQGPTFLNLPAELPAESLDEVELPATDTPAPPTPSKATLADVAERLADARNPVAVVSDLGPGEAGRSALVDLAETLEMPVYESPKVRHAFPMDHPLYLGNTAYGVREHRPPHFDSETDLVFVVGSSKPWYPPSSRAPDAEVVFVGTHALEPRRAHWNFPADLVAEGDPATTLAELSALMDASDADSSVDWSARHDEWRRRWDDRVAEGGDRDRLDPVWFAHRLDRLLPDDCVVVNETLDHGACLTNVLTDADDRRYVSAERMAAGGLGTGLGLALGAKLAAPDRIPVALVGDGAYHYNPVQAAFGAAREHDLPILAVVFDNGGYQVMRESYESAYPDDGGTTDSYGAPIDPAPDYAAQVEAWDMHSETVGLTEEVDAAVEACVEAVRDGTPALLHARLPETIADHP